MVLTRRRDAENPQGHLWDTAGYSYAAYVTDVDWAPEDVVAFYDKPADMEKAIHELKEDFGIDRITSSSFGANAADLEFKVLTFNLLALYQRQVLGWVVIQRAKTLRRRVIAIAGQLIRTAGQGASSWPTGGPTAPTWRGRASLWQRSVRDLWSLGLRIESPKGGPSLTIGVQGSLAPRRAGWHTVMAARPPGHAPKCRPATRPFLLAA